MLIKLQQSPTYKRLFLTFLNPTLKIVFQYNIKEFLLGSAVCVCVCLYCFQVILAQRKWICEASVTEQLQFVTSWGC